MAENKRYYWLRLQNDFFSSLRIKKLRKLAGGDTFTIIYLKMQLLSLKTNGILEYKGIEETFEEEMALELDEEVDNVRITIQYLLSCGLLETDCDEYMLPYVIENTGVETQSTIRSRKCREKQKALQCNTDATFCNGEIEKEIEIDKEKSKKSAFAKPSLEEVKDYIFEKGYNVNADTFWNFYESNGWKVGKNPMKNWKAAIAQWSSRNAPSKKQTEVEGWFNS